MKRILVATDLSPRSDRAIARALALRQEHGAEVTLLHVVEAELPNWMARQQSWAAQGELAGQVKALAGEDAPGIEIRIVTGHDWEQILAQADAIGADLVLLGDHRPAPIRDLLRGTTVARVATGGSRPVLVVHKPASTSYRMVVVGVDFSPQAEAAAALARTLAPEAHHLCVHAYDIPFAGLLAANAGIGESSRWHARFAEAARADLETWMRGRRRPGGRVDTTLRHGRPEVVLREMAEVHGADLLVVGTRGHNRALRAAIGSVAQDLLDDPPCDVACTPGGPSP